MHGLLEVALKDLLDACAEDERPFISLTPILFQQSKAIVRLLVKAHTRCDLSSCCVANSDMPSNYDPWLRVNISQVTHRKDGKKRRQIVHAGSAHYSEHYKDLWSGYLGTTALVSWSS